VGCAHGWEKWRLYYSPTSHRLDSYYEIDLPTVLEKGDLEDFKYFYLFFRHGAFLEDASGDCFLDDVYSESNVFAQELGEDLQDNIYEAIKVLLRASSSIRTTTSERTTSNGYTIAPSSICTDSYSFSTPRARAETYSIRIMRSMRNRTA